MIKATKVMLIVMAVLAACLSVATAQNNKPIRADMAIPESPAFILMDMDQSAIMRPGNAKEIAVSIGNFMIGGSTLPQTFGLEISPGMMLMKKSLSEYQNNARKRFLYRMNLSGGVSRREGGISDISLGSRLTLLDETDLLIDTSYTLLLVGIGNEMNDEIVAYMDEYMPDYAAAKGSKKARYDSLIAYETRRLKVKYDGIVEERRDSVKQSKWNKAILEVGLAGMGTSPDSINKNLVATKYGLWATYGDGMWEKNLNLVGVRLLAVREIGETFKQVSGTVVLRSYIGENDYKGFLEGDGTYNEDDVPIYALSLGGEMNLASGIWLETSAGVRKQGNSATEVISSFNIKLATPGER